MATAEQDLFDNAPALPAEEPEAQALPPVTSEDLGIFDPLAAGEALAKESVVLELHFHSPGWSRSIDPRILATTVPTETVPPVESNLPNGFVNTADFKLNFARFRAAKDIIDRKELSELHRFISKTIGTIKNRRCLASNFLASGMYILPLRCVEEVDQTIEELKAGIKYHLDKIEPRWDAIIEKARRDLGPQFNANDYPPFALIRASYQVESRYLSFNVPAALAQVNKAIFERALEKSQTERAEMAQVVRDGMRGGFLQLITHFAERLGRDDDGKLKVFQASTAEKLQDFLRTFENRDIVGDSDLAVLAKKARDLVEGVDPKALRSDEALREALEKGFTEIRDAATAMITVKERRLAFDQEV
jgi:hypothetical protein